MLSKAEMVAKKGFESLYIGLATVAVRESIKNPITKVTELTEKTIYTELRCRLSFSTQSGRVERRMLRTFPEARNGWTAFSSSRWRCTGRAVKLPP